MDKKYRKYLPLLEKFRKAKQKIKEASLGQLDLKPELDSKTRNLENPEVNSDHISNNNSDNGQGNNNNNANDDKSEKPTLRSILGQELPFSEYPVGAFSYPGPDITFTPPPSNPMVVCLGCMSNVGGGSNTNIIWPHLQIPSNLATGSSQVNAAVVNGDLSLSPVNWLPFYFRDLQTDSGDGSFNVVNPDNSNFTFQNVTYATSNTDTSIGQPLPQDVNINISDTLPIVEGPDGTRSFSTNFQEVPNMIGPDSDGKITNTPFMSSVTLNLDSSVLSVSAIASDYAVANLSQEGILWTLWPLAKPEKKTPTVAPPTYFNDFKFGTAKASNYRIGQMGYFYNNRNLGCIPMGAELASFSVQTGLLNPGTFGQFGINNVIAPDINYTKQQMNPGIQGFYRTLLVSTIQVVAILVVKVSEEIARVINPTCGEIGEDRFIYVGYDGWAVIRTTANPVGPMMAQTYITPQTVTGSVTKENYQVVFPPNFYNEVFYKNGDRVVPIDTRGGLSYPAYLDPLDSREGRSGRGNQPDLYQTIQNIIRVNNITDPKILEEISNIRFNPTDLINVFDRIAFTREYETTLGPGTVKFTLYRDGTNEDLIKRIMDSPSLPVLNFNSDTDKPDYIDGRVQVYPRFPESISPYVLAILESKNNAEGGENQDINGDISETVNVDVGIEGGGEIDGDVDRYGNVDGDGEVGNVSVVSGDDGDEVASGET